MQRKYNRKGIDMSSIPDALDQFDEMDVKNARREMKYRIAGKVCNVCGQIIYEDHGFMIDDTLMCESCADKWWERFKEDSVFWLGVE